ncbi:MAG: DUF4178 domain-containing protein [Lentisphaeraceae bacterium]|nr:DUF4178 domain-containing protein [Lentisphaeraceae bacterium]
MGCPSCGAEITYDKRFAVITVCEYCNSAVIFDEKVASIAGKMSAIAKSDGPLFVGASGSFNKSTNFSVIGRVRYGYENGFWDEWYLRHEDDSTSWFTEDEKRFMHEHAQKLEVNKESILNLSPGQNLELNNVKYGVREIGTAVCEGGQGFLPFQVLSGEEIPFIDLVGDNGETATIEVEPDGTVKFYQGTPLERDDIHVDNTQFGEDEFATEKAAGEGQRERVSYDSSRAKAVQCIHCGGTNDNVDFNQADIKCVHCKQSLEFPEKSFDCPSCSAQIQSYTPDAKSLSCQYCHASVSIAKGEPTLLKKLKDDAKNKKRFGVPIKLGQKATFDGVEFIVVGYLRFKEVDGGIYISHEFLMYNKSWGYRWLVCYDGHYTIQEKFEKIPNIDAKKMLHYDYKREFKVDGKYWKFYESGSGKIDWVEGELTWVAKVGDKSSYIEAIAPPEMVVAEITDKEVEWMKFRYLEEPELAEAFKIPESKFSRRIGIAACQINKKKPYQLSTGLLALVFAIVGFLGFLFIGGDKKVADLSITKEQYKEEFLTPEFELHNDGGIYRADFYSPVDNSWVYLDMALVNERDEADLEFSTNLSYYHGYDDGSWSEGSQKDSVYFKSNQGKFRLLTAGNAGQGESGANIQHGQTVYIKIYENVKVTYYFIFFALAAGFISILHLMLPLFFEGNRWKHTTEDDD